ncbi:MAG: putative Zn-dependent protease [Cyclobacteriaceae bacterium]|jgi:predicted Zn-dependent protease
MCEIKVFNKIRWSLLTVLTLFFLSCDDNGDLVLFSIQNDKDLGLQVSEQIASDSTFNILSEAEYPEAYEYLNSMKNAILSSDDITYKDDFVWKLHIVQDDVLNAFATPGGYIYVYTGLIQYLQEADDLAGVIGHEIAHSDQRHSSKQLQRQYGISALLSILLGGDSGTLATIAGNIAGTGATLAFSRDAESEADDYSVRYLSNTEYACNGAASFFQKLIDEDNQGGTPEFLSTHPSPDNRVEDINKLAATLGCDVNLAENTGYDDFKALLPK